MGAPVIVTRPAAPGQRLAVALRRHGCDVAWWPAFDILPPADEAAVRRALDRLAGYDLALFVSPNAVHATAERLRGEWPAGTVIGAVGASTRDAALAELPGAANVAVVAPDDADESGSEGFWRAWRASGRGARRVLLLRAATGRDWIVDQLRAASAEVDALAIYDRCPHRLSEGERTRLRAWLQRGEAPVVVVSSAEAVGTILEQVRGVEGAVAWLQAGRAIATHPRVAQRLQAAGFLNVATSDADDSSVLRKLESFQG
ncbi:MAG TPA: uroporphyrinogen-III synthase [Burkholderiaceae bacterium]|nr:uroporphyrinogen-III synthase [Burkholderiaceae bacterium]